MKQYIIYCKAILMLGLSGASFGCNTGDPYYSVATCYSQGSSSPTTYVCNKAGMVYGWGYKGNTQTINCSLEGVNLETGACLATNNDTQPSYCVYS